MGGETVLKIEIKDDHPLSALKSTIEYRCTSNGTEGRMVLTTKNQEEYPG